MTMSATKITIPEMIQLGDLIIKLINVKITSGDFRFNYVQRLTWTFEGGIYVCFISKYQTFLAVQS